MGHGPGERAARAGGARLTDQARWGAMFATLLKFAPVFIFAVPGVIALALFPGREAKTTFVTLLNELLPNGIRGLVLAALLASLIGSNLSVMNSVSTLVVRDFVLHFRPQSSERAQVLSGRIAIAVTAALGIAAAYLVYTTPDGLYKYLQTISIYLVMPITPAIVFGIMSKRVTVKGAIASVLTGLVFATLFVADQLMPAGEGAQAVSLAAHQVDLELHLPWVVGHDRGYHRPLRSLGVYRKNQSHPIGEDHDHVGRRDGAVQRNLRLASPSRRPEYRDHFGLSLAFGIISAART